MNQSKISVRYAKALYETSVEENILDQVKKDLLLVRKVINVEGYNEMISNPVIKKSEKISITKTIFENQVHKRTFNFLVLLLLKNRESYIEGIIRNFIKHYRDNKGIKAAELITADSVSKEYQAKFKSILEETFHSSIELEEKIRPELIGGFILKVEDQQYDGSISTRLSKIKKRLLETPIEKYK